MFTLDKLNLADLRLLFLAVNCKVNLGESQRRRIFEDTSSVTKVDLSRVKPGATYSKHSKFNLAVSCSLNSR